MLDVLNAISNSHDRLIAGEGRAIGLAARNATPFVLDDSCALALADLQESAPDVIFRRSREPFPFDNFSIKIPFFRMMEIIRRRKNFPPEDTKGRTEFVTYLVKDGNIWIFVEAGNYQEVVGIKYCVNTSAKTDSDILRKVKFKMLFSGNDWDFNDSICTNAFLFGSLMNGSVKEELKETNVSIHNIYKKPIDELFIHEFIGNFRYLMSALALIELRGASEIIQVPAARRRIGNRWTGVPAHRRVTINAGALQERLEVIGGDRRGGWKLREHAVRGHWMYLGADENCLHDWRPLLAGSRLRECCAQCGGRRTFRQAHKRGDSTLGQITKTYEVKHVQN